MREREISFTIKKEDYINFFTISHRIMKRFPRAVMLVVFSLLSAVLLLVLIIPSLVKSAPLFEALLCLFLFGLCLLYLVFQKRIYRLLAVRAVETKYLSGILKDEELSYILRPSGLFAGGSSDPLFSWDEVSFCREDKNIFSIFYPANSCCVFPMRAFSPEDIDLLKELLGKTRIEKF